MFQNSISSPLSLPFLQKVNFDQVNTNVVSHLSDSFATSTFFLASYNLNKK
jgi:hypothetical protein